MVNSKSLQDVVPEARSRMTYFIALAEMEAGRRFGKVVKIKPTSTFRDAEYQDVLYAQGRNGDTRPKVTNARGDESWHNFGRAMDFAIFLDGTITWDPQYYEYVGGLAKLAGLTWGGDWNWDGEKQRNEWDLVHVQYDQDGVTLEQLRKGI